MKQRAEEEGKRTELYEIRQEKKKNIDNAKLSQLINNHHNSTEIKSEQKKIKDLII